MSFYLSVLHLHIDDMVTQRWQLFYHFVHCISTTWALVTAMTTPILDSVRGVWRPRSDTGGRLIWKVTSGWLGEGCCKWRNRTLGIDLEQRCRESGVTLRIPCTPEHNTALQICSNKLTMICMHALISVHAFVTKARKLIFKVQSGWFQQQKGMFIGPAGCVKGV